MADREYIVTFLDAEKVRIRLAGYIDSTADAYVGKDPWKDYRPGHEGEYHVFAPSARRAEQIARVMKGAQK